jgi:hypothetical protein
MRGIDLRQESSIFCYRFVTKPGTNDACGLLVSEQLKLLIGFSCEELRE